MKMLRLLSTSLCSTSLCFGLAAAVAIAAEAPATAPASSLQAPLSSAATVAAPTTPKAYTVAELYKNGTELTRKKVVVQGRAAKVTVGIAGKTWIHIQDGTGDPSKGTNDLICVTARKDIEVGDAIIATGVLTFNVGSRYKIIIEDAAVQRPMGDR